MPEPKLMDLVPRLAIPTTHPASQHAFDELTIMRALLRRMRHTGVPDDGHRGPGEHEGASRLSQAGLTAAAYRSPAYVSRCPALGPAKTCAFRHLWSASTMRLDEMVAALTTLCEECLDHRVESRVCAGARKELGQPVVPD